MSVGILITTIAYLGFRHVVREYRAVKKDYRCSRTLSARRERRVVAGLTELEDASVRSAVWNSEKKVWEVEVM
jgi:hypothetical protein